MRTLLFVAIADVFDALSTDRPYRKALTPDPVIATMRHMSGSYFDPRLLDLFLKLPIPELKQ